MKCLSSAALLVAIVVAGCQSNESANKDAAPDSVAASASANAQPAVAAPATSATWCAQLPRPANRALTRVSVQSDWFEVYRVDDGVFALVESQQWQEAISYLLVGKTGALLFDTGLGMSPIRPVVESLTKLPLRVLNSHTHYDHVGGNAEFENVLAVETPYTRQNQLGFPHENLDSEVSPASFCHGPPAGLDTAAFHTRAWKATRRVADGDTLDLGGRVIEILRVPGHTPDALALLDRGNRLLLTGDTYYDAPVWLYVPETDLDAYERSIARLVTLTSSVTRLLPAHNTAVAEPVRLAEMQTAIRDVRAGKVQGTPEDGGRQVIFAFPHFSILTTQALLDGKRTDGNGGGSGLTTQP
jgi:glyoxylase-like metal-dependent hydrolase (beta-lactamase superfamily II)